MHDKPSTNHKEPLLRERLGGASGTLEAMLEAADEVPIRLPLLLGLTVIEEVRRMQAALDHCRIFLDRIEADYGDNIEYVAARALIRSAIAKEHESRLEPEAAFGRVGDPCRGGSNQKTRTRRE